MSFSRIYLFICCSYTFLNSWFVSPPCYQLCFTFLKWIFLFLWSGETLFTLYSFLRCIWYLCESWYIYVSLQYEMIFSVCRFVCVAVALTSQTHWIWHTCWNGLYLETWCVCVFLSVCVFMCVFICVSVCVSVYICDYQFVCRVFYTRRTPPLDLSVVSHISLTCSVLSAPTVSSFVPLLRRSIAKNKYHFPSSVTRTVILLSIFLFPSDWSLPPYVKE